MKKQLLFALLFSFAAGVSVAEELSGLPRAHEVSEPFCELYVARSAGFVLQAAGYLEKETLPGNARAPFLDNARFVMKTIGFKKIGIVDPGEGLEKDPDNILYQIILHAKFQGRNAQHHEVIVIDEVSTSECGISKPLVILTFPEYRVIGNWQSYSQFDYVFRQTPGDQKASVPITPNLVEPVPVVPTEASEPFCESYVATNAGFLLQRAGYLEKKTLPGSRVPYLDKDRFAMKTIGFKKVGFVDPERIPDEILYQIVVHARFQGRNAKTYDVIAIDEVSTLECSMTSWPLVILVSPEYRVMRPWESYLQSLYQDRGQRSRVTPNLVKQKAWK